MKTLDIKNTDVKEITTLVENFINTEERPIQILTDHEFYSQRKKIVSEILHKSNMRFMCLYSPPVIIWRIV